VATQLTGIRTGLLRYRGLIITVAAVIVVGGGGWLYWSQVQAGKYEEAFRKGLNSWNHRESEPALVELRKAAKVDGSDPELWVLIGRAELASNHTDRALEAWEQALKREPGYKPALFERGKEALYRHVARRMPPPVDKSTGWLPLQLDPAGAADELPKIWADLKPGSEVAEEFSRFAKGAKELLEGRYKDAVPNLRGYTEKNGWDAGALALVGIANHYGALSNRAEQALSEALALKFDKAWVKTRAEARYLQGAYEKAREDYKQADLERESEPLFARPVPSQGLMLWLKADAGVELSGTSVAKWADQSGGKRDAAPKDPALGPQVSPSALRGRPALLFAGGADELRLPDGFEDFGGGLSMFVVGESATPAGEPWSFLSLATGQAGALPIEAFIGCRRESGSIVYSVEDFKSGSPPFVAGPVPGKDFEAYGAVEEPSGKAQFYKRGQPVANGKLTLPSKMVRTRNRVGTGLKGRLAEVLLYNRALSDLERLGVDAYLKDRFFPAAPAPEKR
jgi:tetratricopeptide (TPR) repeat protein